MITLTSYNKILNVTRDKLSTKNCVEFPLCSRYSPNMRILLIDDEEKIIELLGESLANDGHHLAGFTDPTQALKSFFATPADFDVIVTDHLMPSMLGTDIIKKVKAEYPEFPIILATGNYTEELKSGLNNEELAQLTVLQKPYRKDALVKKIEELLQSTSTKVL